MAKTLILLLGDQLTPDIASLAGADPATSILLMAEVAAEARYVRHHKRKIALVFAAMRHFAEERRAEGWTVDYVTLDAPGNSGSLRGEVLRALTRHRIERIVLVEPGERRLMDEVARWQREFAVPVDVMADDRFLCPRETFATWLRSQRQPRMEYFYRRMRAVTGLLMEGDAPAGGRWNFDAENRKPAPTGADWPPPPGFEPDGLTRQVLELVQARFADHFGALEAFDLPVTRAQALLALAAFIETALPRFGDYQDAMVDGEPLLAHSRLSAAINLGLLRPLEVCRAAEAAWRSGHAPLNAAEGFIRQILGWREYVRGLYWAAPQLAEDANFLCADRALPEFYWTGETPMRCLAQAVAQTRELAYAHHTQRLMVLGNFALLAGVRPRDVHLWFLVVYADAYEWVELPNVIGMSQFADGGLLASKPYAASGAYIDRMSDHCRLCRYDVKAKGGADACPFNYLYWDFLARNRARLARNPRLRNAYATYDRLPDDRRRAIAADARAFLDALEPARRDWAD